MPDAVGERAPVAVLISGRGSNMAALIAAAQAPDCPFRIALVFSNDPDAPGLAIAQAAGIATAARSHKGLPRAEFDAQVDRLLRDAGIGFVALAGYMRLLSPGFVESWAGRMINIHPSLLPAYKGLDTHARALADGAAMHGCSVHLVTAALDDGPVLMRAEVPVLAGDTPATLAARVLDQEHRIYPLALAALVRARHPRRAEALAPA